jgi:protein-L-isoaspartate(D-aspartate) O-methyltransferase
VVAGGEIVSPDNGIGMTSQRTRDRLVDRLRREGISNEQVLEVMRNTPRHLFLDEALASRSYEDTALPIAYGQTISQPYIVARMTELLLQIGNVNKVLEVGTGSGYQAAILSQLVPVVHSVERIEALINQARQRFFDYKYNNIRLMHRDGYQGWPEHAPYDGIIVTAAPAQIPRALLEQLAVGGRLVVPLGEQGLQRLVTVTRAADGYEQETQEYVSFVPLLAGID